jgi:hypothetical protein
VLRSAIAQPPPRHPGAGVTFETLLSNIGLKKWLL